MWHIYHLIRNKCSVLYSTKYCYKIPFNVIKRIIQCCSDDQSQNVNFYHSLTLNHALGRFGIQKHHCQNDLTFIEYAKGKGEKTNCIIIVYYLKDHAPLTIAHQHTYLYCVFSG